MQNQDPTEVELEPKKQPDNHIDYFAPKILWTIIIVLLLVVVAGAAAWYQEEKKTAQNSNLETSNKQQENSLADWKTYTNTEYGFEFMYPTAIAEIKTEGSRNAEARLSFSKKQSLASVVVDIYRNEKELKLSDWYKQELLGDEFSSNPGAERYKGDRDQITNLDNGIRILTPDWYGYDMDRAFFAKDQIVVRIFAGNSINKQEFNQILSTFKFINASNLETSNKGQEISTASWKTYTNDKYGFEMKYPDDLMQISSITDTSSLFKKIGKQYKKNGSFEFKTAGIVNEKGLSLEEYFKNELSKGKIGELNSYQTFEFVTDYNQRVVNLFNKNTIVVVYLNELDSVTFDKILSTFKFTK